MTIGKREALWGVLVVAGTLALMEATSYSIVRFGLLKRILKKVDVFETESSDNFDYAAANFRALAPTQSVRSALTWSNYAIPPVRVSPHVERSDMEPDLLVTQFRRVKLNDDPADNEAIVPGTFTILLSGNSTGMGFGATSNSRTFAAVMQRRLREKLGVPVQVLNFAVPDFKFPDELLSFVMRWTYLRPDVWFIFNGDNDSTRANASLPTDLKYLVQRRRFAKYLLLNTYWFLPNFQRLMTIIHATNTQQAIAEDFYRTTDPAFKKTDEEIYLENLRLAGSLAAGSGIRLVHALQPIMWADDHEASKEEEDDAVRIHRGMGLVASNLKERHLKYRTFYAIVRAGIENLRKSRQLPADMRTFNLDGVFAAEKGKVYYDTRHYNDAGQKILGEHLANLLLPTLKEVLAKNGENGRAGRKEPEAAATNGR